MGEYSFNVLMENLEDEKDCDLYDKFGELSSLYGDYVEYHCNKCNSDDLVSNLNDDKSCSHCDGTKYDIELIEDNEVYKKLYLDGVIIEEDDTRLYHCNNCDETQTLWQYIANDLKCKKCNKNDNIVMLTQNEYGDYVDMCDDEEYDYHCTNCDYNFTSNLSEDVICPKCNMLCDNSNDIEDKELDLDIDDSDWEDL